MAEPKVETGGGTAVQGDVEVKDGDFVGRDQVTINITWQAAPFTLPEPDLDQLRADYLAYLRDAYRYLDFKGLPQVEKVAQPFGPGELCGEPRNEQIEGQLAKLSAQQTEHWPELQA